MNIRICHRCKYKQKNCQGSCLCSVNQIDIINQSDCPKGYFRGAGDVIAKVTSFIGIKPCRKCKKRQEILNNIIPFS